jgi:hypothetical protein
MKSIRVAATVVLLLALANFRSFADPLPEPNFYYGLGIHTPSQQRSSYQLSKFCRAGFNSIRTDFLWGLVEPSKGKYSPPNWWHTFAEDLRTCGIKPLVLLTYGNGNYEHGRKPTDAIAKEAYGRYAAYMARTYAPFTSLYEIWNEWDSRLGGDRPGTVSDYVSLVRAAASRIKLADPDAIVLGGSFTSRGMRQGLEMAAIQDGLLKYVDGIAVHTYNFDVTGKNTPEDHADWLIEIEKEVTAASNRSIVPLYVTEVGWPTVVGNPLAREVGLSPELQAAYYTRTVLLARSLPFVRGLWWYQFIDLNIVPPTTGARMGLLSTDGEPKLSMHAALNLAPLVKEGRLFKQESLGGGGVRLVKFHFKGLDALAAWDTDAKPISTLKIVASEFGNRAEFLDLLTGQNAPVRWTDEGGSTSTIIPLGQMPIVVVNIPPDAEIALGAP